MVSGLAGGRGGVVSVSINVTSVRNIANGWSCIYNGCHYNKRNNNNNNNKNKTIKEYLTRKRATNVKGC